MKKPFFRSTIFRIALRAAVSLGLMYILFRLTNVNDILRALQQADILYIAIALFLLVFNLGFQIAKWHYLLAKVSPLPFRQVLASFFFGLTLGSFTPGQIGEFGGRALNITTQETGVVVGLTIIDRLQIFTVMTIAGLLGIMHIFQVQSFLIIAGVAAIAAFAISMMFRPDILRRFLERIGVSRLKHRWIGQILGSWSLLSTRDIAITMLLTVCFYLTVFLQLYLLFGAFSWWVPTEVFYGFSAMMFLKSLLPISIADLGTRELGLVYFMSLQGIPKVAAFDASILLFSINILLPALFGLFFFPKEFSHVRPSSNE